MNNFINPQITKQIIIGTKSQSRRKLFHSLSLPFKFRSANINERKVKNIKNNKYDALKIAEAKANYLSSKYKNKIIVAFDTTILFRNKTVYKCDTENCCIKLLKDFNNKSHVLYTGMVFMINNKIIKKSLSETKINFSRSSHQSIQSYVNKNYSKIKSAVGCYNIEGPAKKFFENIEGSFYNIIGLDIIKFLRNLKSI
ncbi:MAG: Maf family protein [Alphaproteobacteria bacterium]